MRKISIRWTLIAITAQLLLCVPVSVVELGSGETAVAKIARVDAKPSSIVDVGLLVR